MRVRYDSMGGQTIMRDELLLCLKYFVCKILLLIMEMAHYGATGYGIPSLTYQQHFYSNTPSPRGEITSTILLVGLAPGVCSCI